MSSEFDLGSEKFAPRVAVPIDEFDGLERARVFVELSRPDLSGGDAEDLALRLTEHVTRLENFFGGRPDLAHRIDGLYDIFRP